VVISGGDALRAIGSGSVCLIDTDNVGETNYSKVAELQPVYVSNLRVNLLAKGASYYLQDRLFTRTDESYVKH
jgi:cyanophycinase